MASVQQRRRFFFFCFSLSFSLADWLVGAILMAQTAQEALLPRPNPWSSVDDHKNDIKKQAKQAEYLARSPQEGVVKRPVIQQREMGKAGSL